MELKDILNLNIKNLADEQYKAIKEHAINKLEKIISLLQADELRDVYNQLKFSASGDGWGDDNYYIDFSYVENENMDLYDIIYKMAELKNIKLKPEDEEDD